MTLTNPKEDLQRSLKRLEKARLGGVFIARSEGPNRKQRRAAAATRRAGK
jgi:hypothetical protein